MAAQEIPLPSYVVDLLNIRIRNVAVTPWTLINSKNREELSLWLGIAGSPLRAVIEIWYNGAESRAYLRSIDPSLTKQQKRDVEFNIMHSGNYVLGNVLIEWEQERIYPPLDFTDLANHTDDPPSTIFL